MDIIYDLISTSYFKVSKIRTIKDYTKHKNKLENLNKAYFNLISPNMSKAEKEKAETISTKIRNLISEKKKYDGLNNLESED